MSTNQTGRTSKVIEPKTPDGIKLLDTWLQHFNREIQSAEREIKQKAAEKIKVLDSQFEIRRQGQAEPQLSELTRLYDQEKSKIQKDESKRLEDAHRIAEDRFTANKKRLVKDESKILQLQEEFWPDDDLIEGETYPVAGEWITFPLVEGEQKVISWVHGIIEHEAVYYRTSCWFGNMVYDGSPPASANTVDKNVVNTTAKLSMMTTLLGNACMEPHGQTELFIAAEFVEDRYRGAPHLRGLHLKDRFPIDTKWGYLALDEQIQYGQDKSSHCTYRFLVYHPFTRPRKINQSSFVPNIAHTAASAIFKVAGDAKDKHVAMAAKSANVITNAAFAKFGHPLHSFPPLDPMPGLEHAYEKALQTNGPQIEAAAAKAKEQQTDEVLEQLELGNQAGNALDLAARLLERDADIAEVTQALNPYVEAIKRGYEGESAHWVEANATLQGGQKPHFVDQKEQDQVVNKNLQTKMKEAGDGILNKLHGEKPAKSPKKRHLVHSQKFQGND